ncbi:MAG: class I SAM-dependent methyltransferase [Rudaea sp.]
MNERVFGGKPDRLRAPERIALLEIDRVTDLCLQGKHFTNALDVGTGSGVFAEEFRRRGLQVSGIDTNEEMIELAGRYVPEADFSRAPAEQIPYPDAAFDLVFLGHVLHETDNGVQALKEARRVARHRVAVLEWPYVDEEKGPPLAHRLTVQQVAEMAHEAGLGRPEALPLAHMVLYLFEVD